MAGMSDVIARLSVFLGLDTAAFERGADVSEKRLKKMERSFEQSGKKLQDLGKKLSLAITAPVAAAGVAVVKMAGDFESSMIKLGISSQASADQLKQMSDLALKLGKDTIFGASDAADAMDELAKSGLSATDILNGAAEATVYLATAAGSELSPAANAITDSMQQFGLTTAQLPEAINQITGAVNQSKLDFQDFALAIGQAGGVAGGLGVEFTDFNTVLAATSSLFASGSDAGTSFKTFLTSLSGNSKQAKNAIAEFGLQFFDATGNMRSMAEIAEELRTKLGGLSEQAKTEVLKTIFGTDAMRTAIGLMNQGADGLDRIAAAIKRTDAASQAAKRMEGFTGQLENLKGAIETLAIRIGQSGVLQSVTALVGGLADLVDALSETNPGILKFVAVVATIAAAVGPVVIVVGTLKSSLAPLWVAMKLGLPSIAMLKLELAALSATGGGSRSHCAALGGSIEGASHRNRRRCRNRRAGRCDLLVHAPSERSCTGSEGLQPGTQHCRADGERRENSIRAPCLRNGRGTQGRLTSRAGTEDAHPSAPSSSTGPTIAGGVRRQGSRGRGEAHRRVGLGRRPRRGRAGKDFIEPATLQRGAPRISRSECECEGCRAKRPHPDEGKG